MAADERLKWLEIRINSSLRPRSEDLKNMIARDDNRLAFYEFVNNEDVKQLFVIMREGRQIEVSVQPPTELHNKSVFFLKCNAGTKLTTKNMDTEVFYMDCSNIPLEHLELLIREVFLPLLATNTNSVNITGSGDDILDTLHGMMAAAEVSQGLVEGNIVLSLPSIEVLAEAAASPWRRVSVFHVLETTVIGWIKQIRAVLRHNPQSALLQQSGKEPIPLDEIHMWERHLAQLKSIDDQLDSAVAKDILQNLQAANSQYAHSFSRVVKDIAKAESETIMKLKFLNTMEPLYKKLHASLNPLTTIKLFKPLMHVLQLVWTHSTYYHQIDKFQHLLRLLSNEVVHRARAIVGDDVLKEPQESYSKLKEVLHMCAAFRGTYLDFKDKADSQNAKNITENAEKLTARPQGLFFTSKVYGSHAHTPQYGIRHMDEQTSSSSVSKDDLLTDSPWPARNAPCFDLLNSFMERCNDVLELVETTSHFQRLADVIEAGGAGSVSFDAMVTELHVQYSAAMKEFFSQVQNVLDIDNSKTFDVAFFNLRLTVKSLERNLSEILKFAFEECPMVHSQLRLLEVFEGISSRQLVQMNLKAVDERLINGYIAELQQVKDIFKENYLSPPCHYNMPDTVSTLMWVRGLKERIQAPMEKIKQVSPRYLEGDEGWQIRDMYGDIMQDLEKFENDIITKWRTNIVSELGQQLKQPLLIADEYDEDTDIRPQVIHVNLDPQLLLLLKEMHYLRQPPFSIDLPESAEELLRNTDSLNLSVAATRLGMIVSKYNTIMKTVSIFEQSMIERKLTQIDKLLEQGLKHLTWRMKESADFIETVISLVCLDVYQSLDIVQTNCQEIINMTVSWSKRPLDVFSAREKTKSYTMDELVDLQKQLTDELERIIVPLGNKIHALVQESYEAVQISQESPAWKNYVDYIDAIVLDGLKETTLLSLKAMLKTLVQVRTKDSTDSLAVPILTIRLELIDNKVTFCPPLDQSTSEVSVQESVEAWLQMYMANGRLVKMLGSKGSYEDFISTDAEVKHLLSNIIQIVDGSSADCKKLLVIFETYAFLWEQDVNKTFDNFLHGILAPNPLRARSVQRTSSERLTVLNGPTRLDISPMVSRASSATSSVSVDIFERDKHSFISSKTEFEGTKSKTPSLDEFDSEIDIYKSARDEVRDLQDYYNEGWIRVNLKPIKQVLTTYASKWMWTYTKYLADQVTLMLETLDMFLKRTEPEIEDITGEESDTASFMRMMRLFNEVSAQQTEMDDKFTTMHRTVLLLRKYGQTLSEKSQFLFSTVAGRWNNLKTKVSLAKQRLGPRIQEESVRITKDLETFAARVTSWSNDLKNSKVYQRDCSVKDASSIIQVFSERLLSLENEAQDLIELQELLEVSVVNFSLIPSYQQELHNLKLMWGTVRVIQEQHEEWKRHRWQKTNTRFLREETNKQLDAVKNLPEPVSSWDVCISIQESIMEIQTCLPLIDDLSNPAMRTRHWKQLVRVTGGTVTIVSDTLRKMTLRELLKLGLQQHGDDVRAIVQRAVKDLDIENALKTTEEVWLSKVFDLRHHARNKMLSLTDEKQESPADNIQTEITGSVSKGLMKVSKLNIASNKSSHSRTQCSSISSLPASLLNVEEEPDTIMLLSNTDLIFEELEHHQVKLQTIQSNSAAGSFLDEVLKWQKKLQTIEAVLQKWLEVQDQWVEMEGVYSIPDVQLSLPLDAKKFALVNKDFKLLMGATEKNSNVLQCCCRKNILKILEHMNRNMEMCQKSLLSYLDSKRNVFPRFFFLSTDDVFKVACSGYDLNALNLHISKLFENVGSLVFEEADVTEKYTFVITGVQSALGERLQFDQVVSCKGQIENWLPGLLNEITISLQTQLLRALEKQRLIRHKTRVIYSAGARKVSVPLRGDGRDDGNDRSNEHSHSNTSAASSMKGPVFESQKSLEELNPGHVFDVASESTWIFNHVTEVVYLATCIQTTGQISTALEKYSHGNKQALKDSLNMIESKIEDTILLLTNLEREKEELISQQNEKQEEGTVDHTKEYEYDGDLDVTVMQSESSHDKNTLDVGRVPSQLSTKLEDGISTTTPLDAVGLVVPPSHGGGASSVRLDQVGQQSALDDTEANNELKMLQLPSQVHKLRTLIILQGHFRDLMQRLSKHISPKESFDWKSQLKYTYEEDTKTTSVTCLSARFEYGFEYLGSTNREVITPVTEQMFVMITRALQAHMGVLCLGSAEVNQNETVLEMSKCLGKPIYMFNCNKTANYLQLQNVLRGMASTGCWLCFNSISLLPPSCLSLLSQLMSTIICALRAGKVTVQLQSEDLQLSRQGACFGVMSSHVPATPQDMDRLLIYPSAACCLPDAILTHFRVVSVTKPDLLLSVKVVLLSQGFTNGQELAKKICQLHDVCHNMLGTNTFMSSNNVSGSVQNASFHGWSMQTLKGIIRVAGSMLMKTQKESFAAQEENSDSKTLAAIQLKQEETALVTTLQNVFLAQMNPINSRMFTIMVNELWPDFHGSVKYGGKNEDQEGELEEYTSFQDNGTSELGIKSSKSHLSESLHRSIAEQPISGNKNDQSNLEDLNEAITTATVELGLLPGHAFQARVLQLSQLSVVYQTILVAGPAGCGKSECIKTFAVAEQNQGKQVTVQSIFTKAVQSEELLAQYEENTRDWKDGLLPALLRKFHVTAKRKSASEKEACIQILQLDGECDSYQMEQLATLLNHNGCMVMANNERLTIPDTVKFIWELCSIENMSPSLLTAAGVLVMSSSDVGWKLILQQWLKRCHETDKALLTELCNTYLEKIVSHLTQHTLPAEAGSNRRTPGKSQFKQVISHSFVNMICTFTKLMEVLVKPLNDLKPVELERYFNYSAVWAFGGTLTEDCKREFSNWWRDEFGEHIVYPSDGTVFDYVVDSDSRNFCKFADLVPAYSSSPNRGISCDAFVHTVRTEQLLHLLGLLTDAGKSVLLVGGNGCGKTAIIRERIHAVCSGEVAEVLSLTLQANRFTNARLLFDRLDERLEWKHGRTFVPRGNKKLLCLVDDINLSQKDSYGYQTACELIREHLDDGGFYSPSTHMWRYVKGITYVTSVNPETTADVPALSQRLLRHFAIFGCSHPGNGELQTIFTALLSSHFFTHDSPAAHHPNIHSDQSQNAVRHVGQSLQTFIESMIKVSVELFDRMSSMFLATAQRCHYMFTIRGLSNIFRNICLSLGPGCSKKSLFLLWQHECFWLCGKRMVNEVDYRRFRQAFITAVKKQFIDDDQINSIIKRRPPLYFNLPEQDYAVITAGKTDTHSNTSVSEEDTRTDRYHPVKSDPAIRNLLERALDEYNKTHPHIRLALYKSVIEQVCRLSRVIASPHEVANTVLVAEGCPARCSNIVRFAASLCGFSVIQTTPNRPRITTSQMDGFKADIISGYCRAGAKKEKILLLLHEDELADRDCLVFLIEFILSGDITHLFSQEEQTTIINSIRTDVTQAGLTYTRDVAWNYFLRTVRDNFRIVFIICGGLEDFQYMCREYPSFTNNMNFIWLSHWSKTQLIEHAMFHLKDVKWMSDTEKENVAHMLASIHLVLRQQDGGEKTNGKYGQLNNTSYEKFVEKFISLANQKNLEINKTHAAVTRTLTQITKENKAAIKLKKQLEHEMVVLEERKAGTIQILSQIGHDTAISEQQIRIVRKQQEKVTLLEKRLPDYQVAHERAVYKIIAIVADTKKVVKLMNVADLAEMRVMQKPTPDIEDLMAAIIILLKSPSADLTWQKGAKRQMANLERFIEELTTFDDFQIPESTLALVEPYLKKPSFDPSTMTKMTNNSACGALCKWVQGVVRYHHMMISKVKPLHKKVEETTQAVDGAQKKMNTLENKRKALEIRLADLARSFEEATIDKNEQEKKTLQMKKMLDTAAKLRKVLKREQQRCQQIFDSYNRRHLAISGGCAMAAAFSTYLGPYQYNFRHTMLTVYWPECLRERGIPLVVDSIDSLKGRVVDWSFAFLKTASGASSDYEVNYNGLIDNTEDISQIPAERGASCNASDNDEMEDKTTEGAEEEFENSNDKSTHIKDDLDELIEPDGTESDTLSKNQEIKDVEHKGSPAGMHRSAATQRQDTGNVVNSEDEDTIVYVEIPGLPKIQEENGDFDADVGSETTGRSEATASTVSAVTTAQYNKYVKSLIKIFIGDIMLTHWTMKDFSPWQMENAAILCSSWQRPPMLIDPNNEGSVLLTSLNRHDNQSKKMSLDMENRLDTHFMASLEKAITKGKQVLLKNCGQSVDEMITPILQHCNTAKETGLGEDPQMINFCGRQISSHPEFKLYLTTSLPKPRFNPRTASSVTLINCAPSLEMLTEDLLARAFACIRPDLYQERKLALKNLQLQNDSLYKFSEKIKNHVISDGEKVLLSSPTALQTITSIMEAKLLLARQITNTEGVLEDLEILKDELYPLARRASLLYFLMCSLASICPAYQFTMKYFLGLFDEAIRGDLPGEFLTATGDEGSENSDIDTESDKRQSENMFISQTANNGNREGAAKYIQGEKKQESSELGRTDTEESADTTGVQELLRCSEPEQIPTIEVPRSVSLPTDGVEYTSYPKDKVKQLMDSVTDLVYHKTKRSLFEEDQFLFTTLLLFSIKVESGDITNEELSFLLQGNPGLGVQLTLADFDCKESPPNWLSKEKWEDILAISVLPGAMDSLCVDFAVHSHQWKEWYESLNPEKLQLPFRKIKDNEDHRDLTASDLGSLNDFHKLLILCILRPDRLPAALLSYTHKHLNVRNPEEEKVFNVREVLADARKHWGVLVLLPPSRNDPNGHPAARIKFIRSPAEKLVDLAEAVGIPISRAIVSDGADTTAADAIDQAVRNEGWAIVESVHLATPSVLAKLIEQLQKIHKSQVNFKANSGGKAIRFCIWLTAEKYVTLPPLLIQNLLKIAWNSILSYSDQTANGDNDNTDSNRIDTFSMLSPDSHLKSAIISALHAIPKSTLQKVNEESYLVRRLVFAVVVIHAVLVSRQLCGSVGLIQWHPFGPAQLLDAVEAVSSVTLCSEGQLEPTLEDLCYYIPNTIYGAMVSEDFDKSYISVLCSQVFKSIYRENQPHILIGDILIPIPPNTIATKDYVDWFQQSADSKGKLQGFHLSTAVEKYANNCRCTRFLDRANRMFEALNLEVDTVASVTTQSGISIAKLRSALDICLEQLPPLLDLGDVSQLMEMLCGLSESPSTANLRSTEQALVSKSIGYVLFQECLWMNENLCYIRQDINDLQINLVGGPGALPQRLLSTACSLQEEQIPVTWVHPNCQPCTHSLLSWLEDLKKRHEQFNKWVQCEILPKVVEGRLRENMLTSRPTSVWLGGLVCPQALLTAIRQEKATLAGVSLHDVSFECVVLKNDTQNEISDGGIHLTDIVLENASWDYETNSLNDSDEAGYTNLKDIHLKPVNKRSNSETASGDQEIWQQGDLGYAGGSTQMLPGVLELPVYMNKSRQVQVWSFPVKGPQSPEKWILAHAAFILNSGLPYEECKKSKNYLMLQRLHPSVHANQEEEAEDEEENREEDDSSEANIEDSGEESSRSQLSHKTMSPQQSPLPEEFRLHREMPIYNEQNKSEERT